MLKKLFHMLYITGLTMHGTLAFSQDGVTEEIRGMLSRVTLLKQSTVRIAGEKVIYLDPYLISGMPGDADLVLITHTHSDHLSLGDIRKVAKADSVLVGPEDVTTRLKAAGLMNTITVKAGTTEQVRGTKIEVVPIP